MRFCLVDEDLEYCRALERYYQDHYQDRLSFQVGMPEREDDILIAKDKQGFDLYVHLGRINDIDQKMIKKFQSGERFFGLLLKLNWSTQISGSKTYAFINGGGGMGSSLLAINLAKMLSEDQSTFLISLDIQAGAQYLPQDRQFSVSDLIFHIKQGKKEFFSKGMTGFNYLNGPVLIQDMVEFDSTILLVTIEMLMASGINNIVVDLSNRHDLLNVEAWSKGFLVTDNHPKHLMYIRRYADMISWPLIINKSHSDELTDHEDERIAGRVQLDLKVLEGGTTWSKIIQQCLKKIIEDKSSRL